MYTVPCNHEEIQDTNNYRYIKITVFEYKVQK